MTPTIAQGLIPVDSDTSIAPVTHVMSVRPGEAMHPETIEGAKAEIIAKYGDWTAHNIHLGHGFYTRGARVFGDELKVRRAVQLIVDVLHTPWNQLRILDLGCNEGLYAIEFAKRGASVLGIDGREPNIAKADFARRVLGLSNVTFIQSDVRELSASKHGMFDVVLCWGLLYHLDTPDVFEFAESMRQVCRGLTIVDTHISLSSHESQAYEKDAFWVDPGLLGPLESRSYQGKTYWGRSVFEHSAQSSQEERLKNLWASLDNSQSFWLTRPSLVNVLSDAGFTTIFEVHMPLGRYPPDRVTMVALPSAKQEVVVAPLLSVDIPPLTEAHAVHREAKEQLRYRSDDQH